MEVRACNQSRTACSLGFGVVDGSAEIISSSPTAATVAIDLNYQVGRSYSHIVNGQEFRQEVPADIQALQGSQQISKRIEVAYGEVAHIQLPYGVDVAVCAQKQNASEIVLDRSVCQAF
jgi:capsular polysaccharide biosynthesis protein